MNPHSIHLRNCRTFDEVHLDLPEGLLAILGQNGAGKTTLISAIDVALFGPEGRSLAGWYPRGMGIDPMVIELVFEHGGEFYRVRRSFSPKGRGASKCDLERCVWADDELQYATESKWEPLTLESQTATQEQIEALIGLSRATFRASSYLAQGDAGAFCDAQPRDRKAILAEVIGLSDWDRWLERARAEKRACEMEIGESRAVLERADAELSQREAIADERAGARERADALETDLEKALAGLTVARERRAEVLQQVERRAACLQAQGAADAALSDLRRRIGERDAELARLDERLAQRETLAAAAGELAALEQERESLRAALAAWQEREKLAAEITQAQARRQAHADEAHRLEQQAVTVLQGIGREHCDRCGQILGEDAARRAAESYRADSARHADEADRLTAEKAELEATLAEMPSEAPDSDRLPVLYDLIHQAQAAAAQLAALDEVAARRRAAALELDGMRAELPTREGVAAVALADVEALGPHDPEQELRARAEVERLESTERDLRYRLDSERQHIARYDERLERLARVEQEAAEKRQRVETLLHTLEIRTGMERACSANGIPALILENVAIPQVEVEATRLLRVLGGPATAAELRTLRETKTAGVADTLDIVLQTETGEANYESFSGGEKARIAFALRLALAQLLAARKGSETGLLIIDEIDGLDAPGIAALVSVLEEMQQSVPRIIVVSHQAELRDAFPQSLNLENVGGRSRIVDTLIPPTALEVS